MKLLVTTTQQIGYTILFCISTLFHCFPVATAFHDVFSPYNNTFFFICFQLKNMIAALYSSRPTGSKKFTLEGRQFG